MTREITAREQSKPFPWRCPSCAKKALAPANVFHRSEIKHDGRLHEVAVAELPLLKCGACGELILTNDSDAALMNALREKLGLLKPAEIRGARNKLGLIQREIAAHLGVAEETISRWENGLLIQSRAMDNLLRLYIDLPEVRKALNPAPTTAAISVAVETSADVAGSQAMSGERTAAQSYMVCVAVPCRFPSYPPGESLDKHIQTVVQRMISLYCASQFRVLDPLEGILRSWETILLRAVDDLQQMQLVQTDVKNTTTYRHLRRLQQLSEGLVKMPDKQRDVLVRGLLPLTQLSEPDQSSVLGG